MSSVTMFALRGVEARWNKEGAHSVHVPGAEPRYFADEGEALAYARRKAKEQPDTEEMLIAEFAAWTTLHGYPSGDALDLLHLPLTDAERKWMSDFVIRWDEMESRRRE